MTVCQVKKIEEQSSKLIAENFSKLAPLSGSFELEDTIVGLIKQSSKNNHERSLMHTLCLGEFTGRLIANNTRIQPVVRI